MLSTYNESSTKGYHRIKLRTTKWQVQKPSGISYIELKCFRNRRYFYAVMISSNSMNEEFNFELDNSMLTKPLSRKSFIKCQLIQSYTTDEVISKISSIKQAGFEKVLKRIFETVF